MGLFKRYTITGRDLTGNQGLPDTGGIPSLQSRQTSLDASLGTTDPRLDSADTLAFSSMDTEDDNETKDMYSFFNSQTDPTYELPSTLDSQKFTSNGRK